MTLLLAILIIQANGLSAWWYVVVAPAWVLHVGLYDPRATEKRVAFLYKIASEAARERGLL